MKFQLTLTDDDINLLINLINDKKKAIAGYYLCEERYLNKVKAKLIKAIQ